MSKDYGFVLDPDTGQVTFHCYFNGHLQDIWNKTLEWLPVKAIHSSLLGWSNVLIIELTTGELFMLNDDSNKISVKPYTKEAIEAFRQYYGLKKE